ncbi:MAG: NUDIX domain-containing protein [Patescibacteria group bacterium]
MKQKRKISIFLPIKYNEDELMVYLQKRSADMEKLPNYFGFWGGGAEGDETAEEALIREIKEEMSFDININQVELFNIYEFIRSTKSIFVFKPEDGWENKIVIGEGDYGRWLTASEALRLDSMILEDKVVINDLERILLKKPIR